MSEKKKYHNSTLERRIQTYPPPKYFGLFIAYTSANEMTEAEAAAHMIRCFFDRMPEGEKIRIINCSKNSY